MPDLYIFIQDKLKISILLSFDMYKVNTILYIVLHILIIYYEFTCCIVNSVEPDQLASEDLRCLEES